MDVVALADKDFEGGSKEALPMYDKFFRKLREIESSCLIEIYGCCGFWFCFIVAGQK